MAYVPLVAHIAHGRTVKKLVFRSTFSGMSRVLIVPKWFRKQLYLFDRTRVVCEIVINSFIWLCRYSDLHAFLREEWEAGFLNGWDANDLLTLPHTWQVGDVSTIRDNGDLGKSLSAIMAKGLIIPCKTDLYFPVSLYETRGLFSIDMLFM